MPRITKSISQLQKEIEQARALLSQKEAQLKEKKRKEDTRKKIVAGALVLEHMKYDEGFKSTIITLLDEHLKKENDRALFDDLISPKHAENTAPEPQKEPENIPPSNKPRPLEQRTHWNS